MAIAGSPDSFNSTLPSAMMFRGSRASADGVFDCGDGGPYQVQVQQALHSRFVLLHPSTPEDEGHDAGLAELAREVNRFFEARANVQLALKRKALEAKGLKPVAERLEVTVLLTEKGLQLGYSRALPRKECAPMPRKSLARRLLGPLYPGRRFWVMPEHEPGHEEPKEREVAKVTVTQKPKAASKPSKKTVEKRA